MQLFEHPTISIPRKIFMMRILIRVTGLGLMMIAMLSVCSAHDAPIAPTAGLPGARQETDSRNIALERRRAAYDAAQNAVDKGSAASALGLLYYQARRYKEAEPLLKEAFHAASSVSDKARHANDLGNLLGRLNDAGQARTWYEQACLLGIGDHSLQVTARLNLARLEPASGKLAQLILAAKELSAIKDDQVRARHALELGVLATELDAGLKLAYESLMSAHAIGTARHDGKLLAESLGSLSQIYEQQGRFAEALRLDDQAAEHAQRADAHGLLIGIEWRRGRLFKALGKTDLALSAYQRAVDHIELIRQDIPIEYQDGKSSFRETLEPVYMGLADLLLTQANRQDAARQPDLYRRARDTLELLKQSELEDFLGDRCTVDMIKHASASIVPEHTAVLYPIMLPDRLELLVETSTSIRRYTVAASREDVQRIVNTFAAQLRRRFSDYGENARQLYDWLLRPMEAFLEKEKIDTIIFVPDGKLRLVPVGALHDGNRFVIQKYAVATIPGLTMTNARQSARRNPHILLAGLSEVGPVWKKLPPAFIDGLELDPEMVQLSPGTRGLRSALNTRVPGQRQNAIAGESQIKEMLALSGVEEEINILRKQFTGDVLLNQDFTLGRFKATLNESDYRVVHIASHGFFSDSAAASFIMTYDELLTMDELQSLLQTKNLHDRPIELLTLSACQTALGDDRAPLGFVGAALKARARSALGTLWSVDDGATTLLMPRFYQALAKSGLSKIKALRQAQLALIDQQPLAHPYFWAPFILVGDWQ